MPHQRNHTVKNFNSTLYALQKTKIIQKSLSSTTISHIKKCFTYALPSNKNNPIGLQRNLLAIPHHLFGDHQQCDISWCRFLQSPDTCAKKLFNSLLKVFTKYSDIAEKLSSLESTQINENLNYLVSTKNPKTSSTLVLRVHPIQGSCSSVPEKHRRIHSQGNTCIYLHNMIKVKISVLLKS